MSSVVKYIFGLSLVALVAVACSTKLPREEPLAVSPVQFFGPELREVSNLFIVTDASGTMWNEKTFPTAKALSTSFVRALPDANARSASSDYNVGYIAFGGDDRVAVPLQRFDRQALLAASEKADIMGSINGTGGVTPIHSIIDEIAAQLEGKSGDTAVVIFTDGLADDPASAIASAIALSEGYRGKVCFRGVQVGSDSAGADFLRQLARTTSCGSSQNANAISSTGEFSRYAKNVVLGTRPLPSVSAAPPGVCLSKIRLRGIEFEFDKASVDDVGKAVIDAAMTAISGCPNVRLNVTGYTDSTGSETYNQNLSERRATAVRDYFVSKGLGSGNVHPQGFGEASPVAPNDTQDGRARNRRVELSAIE